MMLFKDFDQTGAQVTKKEVLATLEIVLGVIHTCQGYLWM